MNIEKYSGRDNYGNPKADYVAKIQAMNKAQLAEEAERKIWLSAYANNNPRSDYHWHVDVIYDHCRDLDNVALYERAYEAVKKSL